MAEDNSKREAFLTTLDKKDAKEKWPHWKYIPIPREYILTDEKIHADDYAERRETDTGIIIVDIHTHIPVEHVNSIDKIKFYRYMQGIYKHYGIEENNTKKIKDTQLNIILNNRMSNWHYAWQKYAHIAEHCIQKDGVNIRVDGVDKQERCYEVQNYTHSEERIRKRDNVIPDLYWIVNAYFVSKSGYCQDNPLPTIYFKHKEKLYVYSSIHKNWRYMKTLFIDYGPYIGKPIIFSHKKEHILCEIIPVEEFIETQLDGQLTDDHKKLYAHLETPTFIEQWSTMNIDYIIAKQMDENILAIIFPRIEHPLIDYKTILHSGITLKECDEHLDIYFLHYYTGFPVGHDSHGWYINYNNEKEYLTTNINTSNS